MPSSLRDNDAACGDELPPAVAHQPDVGEARRRQRALAGVSDAVDEAHLAERSDVHLVAGHVLDGCEARRRFGLGRGES